MPAESQTGGRRSGAWRKLASLLALAGTSTCLSTGCGRGDRDRDRSEAGHVLRALEVVRAAPNEGKRRPADELAHTQCSSPIVCGARDSCAEAYQHLARGTEAALRVKGELDKLEKQPPIPAEKMAELSNELDRADTEINGAKDSLRRCEEAASLMRRTFGI